MRNANNAEVIFLVADDAFESFMGLLNTGVKVERGINCWKVSVPNRIQHALFDVIQRQRDITAEDLTTHYRVTRWS